MVVDPYASYAAATRAASPDAQFAVDRFHLIMLANKAVTAVRQRMTRELLCCRGRKTDLAWRTAACCCAGEIGCPGGVGAEVERLWETLSV